MTAGANDDLFSSGGGKRGCGYARYAGVLNATIKKLDDAPTSGKAAGSTLKGRPSSFLMTVETKDIRWTDDVDLDPTASIGHLVPAGGSLWFDGDLSQFRWIETSASAVVHITYYSG